MSRFAELKYKTVRVTKHHECSWCGQRVNKEQIADYRVSVFDGDLKSDYFHPECADAFRQSSDRGMIDEAGFDPGSFGRGQLANREQR